MDAPASDTSQDRASTVAAAVTAAISASRTRPESDSGTPATGPARRVIDVCEAEWAAYKDDCSGFVRAAADSLGVAGVSGNADDIVQQLATKDWVKLADSQAAKNAADRGQFVVVGLESKDHIPARNHGHVAVVVSGPLDPTYGRYPTAYWGSLGSVGERAKTINWAWRKTDRDRVIYAARNL